MADFFSSLCSIFKSKLLLSKAHCLNIESLNKVRNQWENLGMDEGMGKYFDEVMKSFTNEPLWVMKNAHLVLKADDGKVLCFTSGKKEWKINVSAGDYKFHVKAPSKSAYLARLHSRPQPLSTGHLKKVKKDLKTFGPLTEAEKSCFKIARQRFSKESTEIQNNAQMKFIFDTDGENVEYVFVSGNGDNKMKVTYSNGQPLYRELHVSSDNKLDRYLCFLQALDANNLREIKNELAQWHLLTDSLKSCFNHLVDKLPEYSQYIEENPQIYFTCYEQRLFVNSKSKDWEITTQNKDGKVDSNLEPKSWELFKKQNQGKTHELTLKKLDDMRGKLRTLPGVPKHVRHIFNKALDAFCEEMSCLQKNAHLIIDCGQGEMAFVSGEGKNRIDMFYLDDGIHSKISRTWLMILLRFHKHLPKVLEAAVPIVAHALPLCL